MTNIETDVLKLTGRRLRLRPALVTLAAAGSLLISLQVSRAFAAAEPSFLLGAEGVGYSGRHLSQIVGVLRSTAASPEEYSHKLERKYQSMREDVLMAAAARRKGLENEETVQVAVERYAFEHLVSLYFYERVTVAAQEKVLPGISKAETPELRRRLKAERKHLRRLLIEEAAGQVEPEVFDEALAAAVKGSQPNPVVALVGDREIRYRELLPLIAKVSHPSSREETDLGVVRSVLSGFIVRVQIQAAARREGLDRRDDYLQDVEDFRVRKLADLFRERYIYAPVQVEEEEIEQYYQRNRESLRRGPEKLIYEVLLPDWESAVEVRAQLVKGAPFAEIVQEHSVGTTKERNGRIGYVGQGQLFPSLDRAVTDIAPGGISPVVNSPYGYHVLICTEETTGRIPELAQVKTEVMNRLIEARREEGKREMIEKLEKEIPLDFDEALWKEIGEGK